MKGHTSCFLCSNSQVRRGLQLEPNCSRVFFAYALSCCEVVVLPKVPGEGITTDCQCEVFGQHVVGHRAKAECLQPMASFLIARASSMMVLTPRVREESVHLRCAVRADMWWHEASFETKCCFFFDASTWKGHCGLSL